MVETSLLDGVLAYLSMYWGESDAAPGGDSSSAMRSTGATATTRVATGAYRCSDGEYIGMST
ncbi:MAG TPA: hypothetical protein PLV68_00870, partial [Ilumatobacteraceae bacterium]|nr:hypothetical protein [Ilumatobacteraceae bacterium]